MFDDLNDETEFDDLPDLENVDAFEAETLIANRDAEGAPEPAQKPQEQRVLGMTAIQRFIIAVMLMINVAFVGFLLLVATGRFWI